MAKVKSSKGTGNIPNKILHSRISYLYQAATYLAAAQQPHSGSKPTSTEDSSMATGKESETESRGTMATESSELTISSHAAYRPASRRLISDLRSVTLKGQMRISPTMKHSICKKCDTMLIDGSTCANEVENKSKDGKKPWADVLVRKCFTCGLEKRFPVATKRQPRRPHRQLPDEKLSAGTQNG
jgi:ribonuclease P protein subunit RPR2